LPVEVSGFIGRGAELKQLHRLQPRARLLTLVGPGGIGKSRLARRLAGERARAYPDGTWLVDVAPLAEPDQLPQAVARTLGIAEPRAGSWTRALLDALPGQRLLLMLDTCERHLAACADLAQTLLTECPAVQIVATTTEPLQLSSETVWAVPPLSVPSADAPPLRQLRSAEAYQLFVERATAAEAEFASTAESAGTVAEICRKVDGLPLALELVAAHSSQIGLKELAARMDSAFVLGLEGRRGAPARQHTLRASFDWTFALMSRAEGLLLRRLAVFVGVWTLEAAMAVCAGQDLSASAVVDLLQSLIERSLVVVQPTRNNSTRYGLLNVTRQYGLEQLQTQGELLELQRQHLEWYLSVAQRVPARILDTRHADALESELADLRAALAFSLSSRKADLGLRLALAMLPFWFLRSQHAEGQAWLDRLLAIADPSVSPERVATAHTIRDQFMVMQGDYDAAESDLATIVEASRARGNRRALGRSLLVQGNAALWRGDLERARDLYREAQAEIDEPDEFVRDLVLYQLARVAWETGDVEAARALVDRIEASRRPGLRPIAVGRAKQIQALLQADSGDRESALRTLSEAASYQREIRDGHGLIDSLLEQGAVLLRSERPIEALEVLEQAARHADAAHARIRVIRAIEGISRALARTDPALGVQLASAAAASRASPQTRPWPRDKALLDASLAAAQSRLGAEAYARAWHNGATMLEAEAVALALASAAAGRSAQPPPPSTTLTQREREVVRLLAGGASSRQIAERLVISPATVRTHLDRVMAKLGLHSRVQLATWAAQSNKIFDG
jgi:non-specific serine/threonine protein kinase